MLHCPSSPVLEVVPILLHHNTLYYSPPHIYKRVSITVQLSLVDRYLGANLWFTGWRIEASMYKRGMGRLVVWLVPLVFVTSTVLDEAQHHLGAQFGSKSSVDVVSWSALNASRFYRQFVVPSVPVSAPFQQRLIGTVPPTPLRSLRGDTTKRASIR